MEINDADEADDMLSCGLEQSPRIAPIKTPDRADGFRLAESPRGPPIAAFAAFDGPSLERLPPARLRRRALGLLDVRDRGSEAMRTLGPRALAAENGFLHEARRGAGDRLAAGDIPALRLPPSGGIALAELVRRSGPRRRPPSRCRPWAHAGERLSRLPAPPRDRIAVIDLTDLMLEGRDRVSHQVYETVNADHANAFGVLEGAAEAAAGRPDRPRPASPGPCTSSNRQG